MRSDTTSNESLQAAVAGIQKQLKRIENLVKEQADVPSTDAYPASLFTAGYSVMIEDSNPSCILASTRMPDGDQGLMVVTTEECLRLSDLLEMSVCGDVAHDDGEMAHDYTADVVNVYSHDHGAQVDYALRGNGCWLDFSAALAFAQELRHAVLVSQVLVRDRNRRSAPT
jgi:hypothetical protein